MEKWLYSHLLEFSVREGQFGKVTGYTKLKVVWLVIMLLCFARRDLDLSFYKDFKQTIV